MPVTLILLSAALWVVASAVALAASKGPVKDEPLIKEHKWKEAEAFYTQKLLDFADAKGPKSDKDLVRTVLCYDIAHYFQEMSTEDADTLADWLLSEPDFTARLVRAFGPEDSPKLAFQVLESLRRKFGARKVLDLDGLAIAYAVVWDKEKPLSKTFDACDSFGYYVTNARSMVFNLSQLPYEPALFLACAEAPPQERLWALKGYKRPSTLSEIYHSPPYDMDFLFGKPKKIDQHEYTLPNLLKYGGICGDRSYFAANVARALGIPAASISGVGERGGHAWTGYIQPGTTSRYTWDLGCGRYEYDRYYVGTTRDPQTGKRMNDYALAMRTLGCSVPADRARVSDACVRLAGILEKSDRSPLLRWAVDQAIKNNAFNMAAWEKVTRLCKSGAFDEKYADRMMDEALKKFPDELDFCHGLFVAMMETVPNEQLARRSRLYQQAGNYFKSRPDLHVAVGSDFGDYLLEIGKKREAYDVYYSTIRAHMDDPRLVADMAIKVTQKRLEGDEPKKAVTLLTALIRIAPKPPYGDAFARESEWYRLQKCLMGVYKEMGDDKAQKAVEAQLSKYRRQ